MLSAINHEIKKHYCLLFPHRAYKTIEDEDLRFPLVYGKGKKARVMATIGVARGLGAHDLKVHDTNIYIKPFLSCCPEVNPILAHCVYTMAAQDLAMRAKGVPKDRGWRITNDRQAVSVVFLSLSVT
uniref:Uncharacterized protein n=1 Tax=Hucho hucho TaxID=62062 RepID=A0A4W5JT54_9TELE